MKQDPALDRVGKERLLYAPQGSEEWPVVGTVQSIGPLVRDVAVGDRVLFKRLPDTSLNVDPREGTAFVDLLVFGEDQILAVVTDET